MKNPKLHLCIFGCAGFVGSHLLERLLKDTDHTITGIDLADRKIGHLLDNGRLTFLKQDYHSLDSLDECIEPAKAVLALTALCNPALYNRQPLKVIEANYTFPVKIVEACARRNKRLIYFSTSEVYGKTAAALGHPAADQKMEEDATHLILGPVSRQRWTYAAAKQLMERVIYAYGREQGLAYTIIRPFNFIGPRMDFIPQLDGEGIPRVLACFMESLFFNKPLLLVDGGKNQRVFTYIDDAVEAVMRIIARPEPSLRQTFNIGNPANEVSIRQLAELMLEVYPRVAGETPGPGCVLREITSREFYGDGYDDCDRRLPDITRAEGLLGWHPRVGLREALEKSMTGYLAGYKARLAAYA